MFTEKPCTQNFVKIANNESCCVYLKVCLDFRAEEKIEVQLIKAEQKSQAKSFNYRSLNNFY